MPNILTVSETSSLLLGNDNFLILTHNRPDGDTIGSGSALTLGLRSLGKTAYMLENREITDRYKPLAHDLWAPADYRVGFIISVDTATFDLFPDNAKVFKDRVDLCIDHHPTNGNYAKNLLLNDQRASCGEIVYDVLIEADCKICSSLADRLYVAVSTDTGCFSYGNTNENAFFVASKLAGFGADIDGLNDILFRTVSRGRMKIEGMVNTSLEFHYDDKVALSVITKEMIDTAGAVEDDLERISALPMMIDGVFIGLTLREIDLSSEWRLSARTGPPYKANEICSFFGGGGHNRAAGATVSGSLDDIKSKLLDFIGNMIKIKAL